MSVAIVWLRYDLRLKDNIALYEACLTHDKVIPLYIYDDKNIPLGWAQRWWLHYSLQSLKESFLSKQMDLIIKQGNAKEIILDLVKNHKISSVYWSRRYDQAGINYDSKLKNALHELGINCNSYPGLLLNEPWTIKNQSGDFFKVFTPYWKHCLNITIPHTIHELQPKPVLTNISSLKIDELNLLPVSPNWAKNFANYWQPGESGAHKLFKDFIKNKIDYYAEQRDFPAVNMTSRLSPHLHFGEISPNYIWQHVKNTTYSSGRFIAELGWREFSYNLLYNFPKLSSDNFRAEFDNFIWQKNEKFLIAWQKGLTGYPIVDAGMRELWVTGGMHNRLRMIVASFLTKDLFIDWRVGAEWFWDTLVDADLANNSASWQWVAGCGADAAPYFRIFNPFLQSKKFDPMGTYIKTWVPELKDVDPKYLHQPDLLAIKNYPKPIVDHDQQRKIALEKYQHLKQ